MKFYTPIYEMKRGSILQINKEVNMNAPGNMEEIIRKFSEGPGILENAVKDLSEADLDYIPKEGGWSIREIIHHITDGDDLWKTCIKIALGNEEASFTLKWYLALTQLEWSKRWSYKSRSVDVSLALFKANRNHIIQLINNVDDGWNRSVHFDDLNDEIKIIPIGFVIKMQTEHAVHHVDRILSIRNEIYGK